MALKVRLNALSDAIRTLNPSVRFLWLARSLVCVYMLVSVLLVSLPQLTLSLSLSRPFSFSLSSNKTLMLYYFVYPSLFRVYGFHVMLFHLFGFYCDIGLTGYRRRERDPKIE